MALKHVHASQFSEYGLVDIHASDNNLYFAVCELKQTMKEVGVHLITGSPHHHHSNELVCPASENLVCKAKKT